MDPKEGSFSSDDSHFECKRVKKEPKKVNATTSTSNSNRIPAQRQTIQIRKLIPDYIKVVMKTSKDENGQNTAGGTQNEQIRDAFLKLARSLGEMDAEYEEIQKVKDAGTEGKDIGATGWKFRWMKKNGQERISDQLSIQRPQWVSKRSTYSAKYSPVCTYNLNVCFSYNGTLTREEMPRFLSHKGDKMGFAVLEFGIRKGSVVTVVGHKLVSFTYENEKKAEHLNEAIKSSQPQLPGVECRRTVFDTIEDAGKTLVVWQTAALFKKLSNPNFKYNKTSVALAIGLEGELIEEMKKVGLELKITSLSNSESETHPFPFGRRADDEEKFDAADKKVGALYIGSDSNINYGGQNLVKMEAHLHISLFVAYLFQLRNPFDQRYPKTEPFCLNKEIMASHFDGNSWNLIRQFLRREYGVTVEFTSV